MCVNPLVALCKLGWFCSKISVRGREARRSSPGLLGGSACALDFFIVYCREVRGAEGALLGVSACACALNIKIKNKTPTTISCRDLKGCISLKLYSFLKIDEIHILYNVRF